MQYNLRSRPHQRAQGCARPDENVKPCSAEEGGETGDGGSTTATEDDPETGYGSCLEKEENDRASSSTTVSVEYDESDGGDDEFYDAGVIFCDGVHQTGIF